MRTDVYIIKKGTVEEKYIEKVGFKKKDLEKVTNSYWRSKNYGETLGYRVRGSENIKKMCEGFVEILSKCCSDGKENESLLKYQKIIKAIEKNEVKAEKKKDNSEIRTEIIQPYLLKRFPLANQDEINLILEYFNKNTVTSKDEFLSVIAKITNKKSDVWENATKEMIKVLI